MKRAEYLYACTILSNHNTYWKGYSDPTSGLAWARQCQLAAGNCEVLPADVYKTYYILVKNGFPILVTENLENYKFEYHWNTNLYRNWQRKETDNPKNNFDDFHNHICQSSDYAAFSEGTAILSLLYLRLPDAQMIRLTSSLNSIMASTGRGSVIKYFNLSDSWIDVGLYNESQIFEQEWRVYGADPDPWEAPSRIKNLYESWPPEDYSIKICNNLTGVDPGQQFDGANTLSEDNVYSTTAPRELASWAVQGLWSGRFYQDLDDNVYAHDIVSTQFKDLRIEKRAAGGYLIYLSFGSGRLTGYDSNFRIQVADNTNQWDNNPYYITLELVNNTIVSCVVVAGGLPDFIDETILYDSSLDINLIGNALFAGKTLDETLSPAGKIENAAIVDKMFLDFVNQGYSPSLVEGMPLLKRIGD